MPYQPSTKKLRDDIEEVCAARDAARLAALAAAFYSFCDVEPGVQEDLDRRQEEAKAEYSRLQGTFAAAHPGVVLESIPNPR